ncbi:hypothetical protein K438DRAFT_1784929 [Mycena galopus ATCC 62051]|nr:hypothetical protein K438DRAFT_1784929 [Mycena galopus ATCC 62051]
MLRKTMRPVSQDAENLTVNTIFYGALPILTDRERETPTMKSLGAALPLISKLIGAHILSAQHLACPASPVQPDTAADLSPEPLSLIRDTSTSKKLPTILYRSTHKPIFHIWTTLLLPKITAASLPAGSSVLLACNDGLRRKKTLRKEISKLKAVHGRTSDKDQRFVLVFWNALCAWPKGFRKAKHSFVKKAVAFKAAARRLLNDVDQEVKRCKALHRESAYQKALQKAAEAVAGNTKKRTCKEGKVQGSVSCCCDGGL